MGYSHYWYTAPQLDADKFEEFSKDCRSIVEYSQNVLGIVLADGCAEPDSRPIIDANVVAFNGSDNQPIGSWTTSEEISIPWPSPVASLVPEIVDPIGNKTDGNWYAGTLVTQRVAPIVNGSGSGSYETFRVARILEDRNNADEFGRVFNCTKTAYRPYDLTVTACLIALKYHFPACKVSSDGEDKDWLDGKILCHNLLGYGLEYRMTENGLTGPNEPVLQKAPPKTQEPEARREYKDIKTTAKEIRQALRREFPACKFSVSIKRYTGGQSLSIDVMSCPFEVMATGALGTEKYWQVNHYHIGTSQSYTPEGKALLLRVKELANADNWDHSDHMTDYFDVNYYVHISVGRWDRPFVVS